MSGTLQLDGALFPKDPLTKRWARQRVATSGPGEGIFTDFWQLEMRFDELATAGESDFFMGKFLESGLHTAILPHPLDGSLATFTGVAITDYSFSFNEVDRDSWATNPRLMVSAVPVIVTGTSVVPPIVEYQGAGSGATGGAGGAVIEVTNLNNSGAGSFREAVTTPGARIVNILVDGYINLNSRIAVDNPNMTINGDFSGGKGICLRREKMIIRTNNIIIRHMRFRVGDVLNGSPSQGEIDSMDSLSITNNGTSPVNNIILDHCTFSWGIDENLEIFNSDTGWVENITVQWCLFADPLRNSLHTEQGRAKNLLNAPNDKTRNISFHHNLFVSAKDRNPKTVGNGGYDIISNVLFNIYGSGKIGIGENNPGATAMDANVIGNLEVEGPDQNVSGLIFIHLENNCDDQENDTLHQVYESGNIAFGGGSGWSNVTCCNAGASNIPASTRFQVGTRFAQPGEAITIESVPNLIDILVNGTGYDHAGVGACPGGASGRDARDVAILDELIVARDSGAGAVDTAIIKPVDTPSDVGGYPALT